MVLTLILSLIMMAGLFLLLFSVVAFIQDKRFFKSAPKDIFDAIKPHEERFKGAHIVGWILFAAALILLIGPIACAIYDGIKNKFDYGSLFARLLLMLLLLEIFDILFFDLFLLCHSSFYQHYYPETKGCDGFHSFGFNRKSHILTFVFCFVIASLLSLITLIF